MNLTPIKRRVVSDRTAAGKAVKWCFIGFNAVMVVVTMFAVVALVDASEYGGTRLDAFFNLLVMLGLWALGGLLLGVQAMATSRSRVAVLGDRPRWLPWKRRR